MGGQKLGEKSKDTKDAERKKGRTQGKKETKMEEGRKKEG